jgi:hypothetical protein
MLVRTMSIILGLVFLVASMAKVVVLDAFAATVTSIARIPGSAGYILAATIICVEAVGAIALLAHYKLRTVALIFCVVVGLFLWVLSSAIIQGREIACNCFGVLGITLSNRHELLLDLVLFNAFGVLAFLSPGTESAGETGSPLRLRASTIALIIVVMALEGVLVFPLVDTRGIGGRENIGAAVRWAEREDAGFASFNGGNRAILAIKFSDLSCPLCADDLFALVDSLQSSLAPGDHRTVALFESEPLFRGDSLTHIRRWIAANGFRLPVAVVPDSIAVKIHLEKSLVAVVNADGAVLFSERFPMGLTKRLLALQMLR